MCHAKLNPGCQKCACPKSDSMKTMLNIKNSLFITEMFLENVLYFADES